MVESTASFDVDVLQGLVPGPFGWIRDGKFFIEGWMDLVHISSMERKVG